MMLCVLLIMGSLLWTGRYCRDPSAESSQKIGKVDHGPRQGDVGSARPANVGRCALRADRLNPPAVTEGFQPEPTSPPNAASGSGSRPPGADGVSDHDLIASMAGGDDSALAELYDRYAGRVNALARRILGNEADAEDLLADVFYEFWQRREAYDAGRGSPLTYLLLLTRSRAIDRLRSAGRRPAVNLPDGPDAVDEGARPDASVLADERQRHVQTALSELSEDQRWAVTANFFDGLSHREIAERSGKPIGTVKTYIRQGLSRLRQSLHSREEAL